MPTDATPQDAFTEDFLRAEAKAEGLSYHEFCQKYGIEGPSQVRRRKRREVIPGEQSPEVRAVLKEEMEMRTAWDDSDNEINDYAVDYNGSIVTAKAPNRAIPRRARESE